MSDKYNHSTSDSMNSLAFNLNTIPKGYDIMMEETTFSIQNLAQLNETTTDIISNYNESYGNSVVLVPFWYYSSVSIFLSTLGVSGILLNGFIMWCFTFYPIIRTPYNLILVNLAGVELVIAMVGVTMDVLSLLHDGFAFGKIACIATGSLVTTSGFVSMITLCVLSICRLSSFIRSHRFDGKISSFSTAFKITAAIWIYSLSLSVPPLFGWGRYIPEVSGLGCAPDWHSEQRSNTYVLWILLLGFLLPTMLICFSSLFTCININELRTSISSKEVRSMSLKRDQRALRLVLAMNIAYLMCWSPYAVLCFIHIFISKSVIGPMLSMVPTITVKMSVCINPILYIALNPQFHGTFKRIILRSKAQRRSSNGQKRKTKKREKITSIKLTDLQKKEQKRDQQNGLTMDSYRSQTPQEWVTRGNNSSNDMDVFAVVKDMMPNQNNAYESEDLQFNLSNIMTVALKETAV